MSRGHLAKSDEESLRLRAYARRGIFPDYVGRKNTAHRPANKLNGNTLGAVSASGRGRGPACYRRFVPGLQSAQGLLYRPPEACGLFRYQIETGLPAAH